MRNIFIAGILSVLLVVIAAASNDTPTNQGSNHPSVNTQKVDLTQANKSLTPSVQVKQIVPLSNDKYYTNSAGEKIHSPAYAPSIPSGASARCRDGTYSFSQSRRGTCSHHGGVAEWL
jgi:hypothetical protein